MRPQGGSVDYVPIIMNDKDVFCGDRYIVAHDILDSDGHSNE
jgi:5'(3')-deoxyribonucleotidase